MDSSEVTAIELSEVKYAGFWKRVISYIIDSLVLFVPIYLIQNFIFDSFFVQSKLLIDNVIMVIVWGVYYVFCETSPWQATIGKKVLGIKVTDIDGGRINVAQASIRYIMMIPATMILFIGILMVAFTEKKQGLHDKVAEAIVVCK